MPSAPATGVLSSGDGGCGFPADLLDRQVALWQLTAGCRVRCAAELRPPLNFWRNSARPCRRQSATPAALLSTPKEYRFATLLPQSAQVAAYG